MLLKNNIDYVAFLHKIRDCSGEVHFESREGDNLNLKSVLSQYIFVFAVHNSDIVRGGTVTCTDSSDYKLLEHYLTEGE